MDAQASAIDIPLPPEEPLGIPLLAFEVLGQPAPQGSKVAGFNPRTGTHFIRDANANNLKYWRSDIAKQCQIAMRTAGLMGSYQAPALLGAVQLGMVFHFARPPGHFSKRRGRESELRGGAPRYRTAQPDLDKLARGVADALRHAGLYNEDSHVVRTRPKEKVWSNRNGVQIWVWNLEPDKVATANPLHVLHG